MGWVYCTDTRSKWNRWWLVLHGAMQLVYSDAEHVRFGRGYQDDDQGGELVVLDGAEVGHEGH
jgi:hypothetical protein